MAAWQRDGGDERIAELERRLDSTDANERAYARAWLPRLLQLRAIAERADLEHQGLGW